VRVRAPRHADQALEVPRFFIVIGAPEAASCLQFAATRLKFAARLRKIRESSGHAPSALQRASIFPSIRSGHLDFAASGTP
jgi:hypothetical protein